MGVLLRAVTTAYSLNNRSCWTLASWGSCGQDWFILCTTAVVFHYLLDIITQCKCCFLVLGCDNAVSRLYVGAAQSICHHALKVVCCLEPVGEATVAWRKDGGRQGEGERVKQKEKNERKTEMKHQIRQQQQIERKDMFEKKRKSRLGKEEQWATEKKGG